MLSIDRLTQYLAVDPSNVELAADLTELHLRAGDPSEAVRVLHGLPPSSQSSPRVQFLLAQVDLAAGRYGAAEERLVRLREGGHDSLATGHDLAFALLCQSRLDEARAVLSDVDARHPGEPAVQILHARIELMAGNMALADQWLGKVLDVIPSHPEALGLRALGLLDAGDDAGAQANAAACLAVDPDQHEALITAGSLALANRQPVRAQEYFSRALLRFPNSGRALSGSGQVQMLQGELQHAGQTLARAVACMPDHIGTWHALAWAQLLCGDVVAAEASYRSALALDRNFAESHGGIAIVALLTGRTAEGEASMTRALKLDPGTISGRYARTLWLQENGRETESTALFAELMARNALPGIDEQDPALLARRLRSLVTARSSSR
ncbi:tetratricopeptide repeat protein [Stenotrophomonas acidaminiphila]